ncbi:MAG: hypothetical protein KA403_02000 [Candidatus Omnitrophica bacterium]|nr:hypothetical protein [Candidatus Omnitrophota bacterium]
MGKARRIFISIAGLVSLVFIGWTISVWMHQDKILQQIIGRLQADSRIAEVLVTGVNFDEKSQQTFTTIKFLEYNSSGVPIEPKYFTFSGNIIQFQSLVMRFDDVYIRNGDKLKGKSAYLFLKAFMLDGKNTQEFDITTVNEIPAGYKVADQADSYEAKLWKDFWGYALNPDKSKESGIKNAQIEAPGTLFVPGNLYTIKIEHDGGMRIDVSKLSPILQGETIPKQEAM